MYRKLMVNQTQAFLGGKARWRAARIELDDVQPRQGGRRVRVAGTGSTFVQVVAPTGEQTQRAFVLLPEETQQLFALCVEGDILATPASAQPDLPDAARPAITLVNAGGQRRAVAVGAGEMAAAWRRVCAALRLLADPPPADLAARRWRAALNAQLAEKHHALDRFGHQPHTVALIEREIAELEALIAAQGRDGR